MAPAMHEINTDDCRPWGMNDTKPAIHTPVMIRSPIFDRILNVDVDLRFLLRRARRSLILVYSWLAKISGALFRDAISRRRL